MLTWDDQSSVNFGSIKAGMEKAGTPIDDFEIAIAAIAMGYDAAVITANLRTFHADCRTHGAAAAVSRYFNRRQTNLVGAATRCGGPAPCIRTLPRGLQPDANHPFRRGNPSPSPASTPAFLFSEFFSFPVAGGGT